MDVRLVIDRAAERDRQRKAESRAANGRGRGREDRGADQGRAAADQQPQGRLSDRVDEKTTVMTVRKIPFLSQLAERPERTRRSQVHGAWRPKAAKERTRGRLCAERPLARLWGFC